MRARVTDHLTYANVVATLALLSSLGGASYAAITLPKNSVGTKQLRANAVTLGKLDFPLGSVGVVDNNAEDLVKGACNSPLKRGEVAPPCTPPILGSSTPGREVHITVRATGGLLVSAIAGLRNGGAPQTTADVTLAIIVDGRSVTQAKVESSGGQSLQVPIQAFIDVSPGRHTTGLAAEATYTSNAAGDVLVAPVSIVASAAPRP